MYERPTSVRTTRKELTSLTKRREKFQLTQPFLVLISTYQFLLIYKSYAGLEPIIFLLGLLETLIYDVNGNKQCAFIYNFIYRIYI